MKKLLRIFISASTKQKWLIAGVSFALLWASASTATKIGLSSAQPLMIAAVRFMVAAAIMLFLTHIISGRRLPKGKEWKQLAIYGLLNITIYLGSYVIALQTVTAGIASLGIAASPVFISFLSIIFLKKKLTIALMAALVICTAGVLCAAWPLFGDAKVTADGLLILLFSMLSYSVAGIYFSLKKWNDLHLFTINGWQTLIGGAFIIPVAMFFYDDSRNSFGLRFWGSVLWLAIPVSIFAVQLWLILLRANTMKAAMWLFLCPVFGFIIAALVLNDSISIYTFAGVGLVISGLFLSQKQAR